MSQVSLETLIAAAISGECVVSFPTDTVPALAVKPDRSELIFKVKQRRLDKPLILMGGDADSLWPFVKGSAEEMQIWQNLAQQYWPGALTLVLPASEGVPAAINPTDPTTIGIRVPACAIAQRILKQTGPLATTSANRSGQPPLLTRADIEAEFPEVLTLLDSELEFTSPASQVPSTVVKWTINKSWEILRQGAVKLEF